MNAILNCRDDRLRSRCEQTLGSLGFHTAQASGAAETWSALLSPKPPTLLIADMDEEDFSGVELCRSFSADPFRVQVHIMLTAPGQDEQALVAALQAGADDVLCVDSSDALIDAKLGAAHRVISARQELTAIYETAPLAMLLFDKDGRLSRINPAGAFLSSPGEGRSAPLRCFNALNNPAGCGAKTRCGNCSLRMLVLDSIRTGRRHLREEVTIPSIDSYEEEAVFLASATPMPCELGRAVLVCLEDITPQKRTELCLRDSQTDLLHTREQLHALNHELEDKVQQRTAEVRDLLQQKDRFVSQLGHDLKTPLTPLMGLLPLLERMVDDPRARRMLDVLQDNVTYMDHLVEQTLNLARMNTGGLGLQWSHVDLRTLTRNVIASLADSLSRREIRVDNLIVEPVTVWADPMRLREVLTNLLDNAMKYTEGPGMIVFSARRCGQQVELSIADTGIGMTPEQADHAFDEFYKADSSRHDRQSNGLGLTICRRIVEAHGGSIHLTSDGPDQGITAHLLLPVHEGEHALPAGE
ncbi:MAG: ATP-binding protein [Planctomycetota bacterium]